MAGGKLRFSKFKISMKEGLLFFLFLGKSTLQSPVSYSVTKKIPKKNVKFRRSGTLTILKSPTNLALCRKLISGSQTYENSFVW